MDTLIYYLTLQLGYLCELYCISQCSRQFLMKKPNRIQNGMFLTLMILHIGITWFFPQYAVIIGLLSCWYVLCIPQPWLKKLSFCLFLQTTLLLSWNSAIYIQNGLLYNLFQLPASIWLDIIATLIRCLITIGCCRMLARTRNHPLQKARKIFFWFSLLAFLCTLSTYLLLNQNIDSFQFHLYYIAQVLIGFALLIAMISLCSQQKHYHQLLQLHTQQHQLHQECLQETEQDASWMINRQIRHDLKNHLLMLQILLQKQDPQIEAYIEKIKERKE